MKILITSGTSFLGGRIAKYFQENNIEITIGYRNEFKKAFHSNKFNHIKINWHSIDSIREACADKDIVIHTAGLNSQTCYKFPVLAYEFNSIIAGNLGIACQNENVKALIYLSSIHVYSNDIKEKINEISECKNSHHYSKSKHLAENIYQQISNLNSTKFFILRLSNLFGYPINENKSCWNLFINNICKEASQIRKITINSNPLENRNFISMNYLNRSLKYLIENIKNLNSYEIFNITSQRTLTLEELTILISKKYQKLLNLKIELNYKKQKVFKEKIYYSSRLDHILKSDKNFDSEINELIFHCENQFNDKNK